MVNFSAGLLIALQGVLIVFAVLIILMVVLSIMKLFAKKDGAPAPEIKVAPSAVASATPIADNDEVIAVISAAVAAMSGDDPTKRLRVMSIKRQGSQMPLWSANNR